MSIKPRNQKKWDSLQDAGQSHIDRIITGTSTEADLTALSILLAEQHELAGQIFDQGVEDAITTANTIVRKIDEKRQAQGKRALTEKAQDRLFDKTFKDVMAAAIEDILGQVHDEFEDHSKEVRNKVNEALERIRDFEPQERKPRQPAPGEVTVTPEQRSLLDRLTGKRRPDQSDIGSARRSLMDRVFKRDSAEDRQRSTMLQVIKEAASAAKDKITSLYDRVRSRDDDGDEEKRATIWMRKLRAIFDPRRLGGKVKEGAGRLAGLLGKIGMPLMAALMNPKLIESITDAVQKHLNFEQISKYVESMWAEAKELGSTALDAVVAKIKSFFGGKEKPKQPAPRKTDPLKQNTHTAALPKEITPANAKAEIPRRVEQLEAAKIKLANARAAYEKNPTEANKRAVEAAQRTVNTLSLKVTQFQQRASEQKTEVVTQAAPTEVSKEHAAAVGGTAPADEVPRTAATPSSNSPEVAQQTSPVSPSAIRNASSVAPTSTEVVGELPKFTEGRAFDMEKPVDTSADKEKQKGAAIAQIGMGSFGFDSSDPAMNILNLGMLS